MGIKTLLYGGAFDMPHIGHAAVALNTLYHMKSRYGFEELWFLPCYSDAFGQKNIVAGYHRLAMLNHLIEYFGSPLFKVCTDELEMANNTGTYAAICHMIKTYQGDREFAYLIGTDQANQIFKWRNWQELIETIPFVVVKRFTTGLELPLTWYQTKPHVFIDTLYGTKNQISSTKIREDFANNWDFWKTENHKFLRPLVQKYILDNGLYKNKEV